MPNSIDIAMALQKEILANKDASQERRDKAAMRLINIARIQAIQRRDVRLRRLQKKLDAALARIAELEAQLPKQEQFRTLREMADAQSQ